MGLQREIVATEQKLKSLEDQAARSNVVLQQISIVGEKFQKAGETIEGAGKKLLPATAAITGIGAAVIKTGMDYESGMSKVQAISGATGDEMALLGEKAMEMAAKTKFSTTDCAEAYQYMAMAGWKASDMVEGLAGIMNLAAASGETLGTTSDIVTDALTAFGLTAADSGRFADVLAAASNNANTNVSMLGESFKYVAPVAGAMGYSVEDVSVALGLMANSGIKASQAGTTLRTAMTNMASPTSNMAAVMKEYSISLTDTDGKMLSFAEIMNVLRSRMGGLDEATQASAAALLFGKEAMSGMLAIINAAPEDYDKLTAAINNSNGTTEEMARIMQDNAAGAVERLESAGNVLFTQLSEHLIPIFTTGVEKLTEWVNWFGRLDDKTQKMIITIAVVVAALGPVLIVIGKVTSAVGSIISVASKIGPILTAVKTAASGLFTVLAANPIGLVIAAVAALVAGFIALWNTSEDFRNFWIGLWDGIVNIAKSAVKLFADIGKNIVDGIKNGISNAWKSLTGWFSGLFDGLIGGVKSLLGIHSPSTVFANIGSNMALGLGEGWDDEYKAIKDKIGNDLDFGPASVDLTANGTYSAAQSSRQGASSGSGDTYVTINSPVAVDAVTAAREWKKTTQRMAMGYV